VSLKDDVRFVKEELSSDEKLLESAFRLERLYKKHRSKILAVVAILVLGVGGKALYGAYRDYRLEQANDALAALRKNSRNTEALKKLEENNPRLFGLYRYAAAVKKGEISGLKPLEKEEAILSDLVRYHEAVLAGKAGDSRYYHDFSLLEKAYLLLKKGEKDKARARLALIPENSPAAGVARLLRHSTLK